MIDELKLIDNIGILLENKVVLYGAGYRGAETARKLKETGMPAAYFCDGDPQKWGSAVEGLEVLSLTDLKKLDATENLAIIIASDQVHFIDQIAEDIAWLKLRTDNVFTMFALTVALVRSGRAAKLYGGHYNAIQAMQRDIYLAAVIDYHLNMRLKWAGQSNITLVYSPPKAGNITITRSLEEIGVSAGRYHTLNGTDLFPNAFTSNVVGGHMQDSLAMLNNCKSVKIITTFREPIGRKLSLIFHLIGHHEFKIAEILPGGTFVDSITELIASAGNEIFDPAQDGFKWFDNELKAFFNIDVFSYPFDKERGFAIINQGNIELLLIKTERLNSLEQVIAGFIAMPRFKLINDNESESKPYKYLYRQVKRNIKIPQDIVDNYYSDTRMRHFYNDEEITGFREVY